jgi:uncharacterized membrane protein YphA (DoxX/SURF4 family)
MSISSALDRLHSQAKQSSWLWLFSIFCRLALALGFIPAAIVKLMDERFASGLHANHPMGHYLEALHLTGYYYTFIGVVQLAAAIFLLIPRTVTLGAFLYFPVILNITVLTYATRFDGSLFTAPLMTLANLYILGWNYEKWKYILPFNHPANDFDATNRKSPESDVETQESAGHRAFFSRYGLRSLYARFRAFLKQLFSDKFPKLFFAGVFAAVVFFMLVVPRLYSVKPRNTLPQCVRQFKDTRRTAAGENFCNCIHTNGEPLNKCLTEYDNAPDDAVQTP